MDKIPRRRIDIATCWASNRITVMDSLENYEDSYAIAEEFREWILHIGQDSNNLRSNVMIFPKNLNILLEQKIKERS
tara:strand:+ start:2762 stop:2992 length:231 start_codon:yes stop_codon:yes gene_type:complete